MSFSRTTAGWLYVTLDCKKTQPLLGDETMCFVPSSWLPECRIRSEFADITTVEALSKAQGKLGPFLLSPTACRIDADVATKQIFRNKANTWQWAFSPRTGVVALRRGNPKYRVARSIPEFLSRVALEDSIWMKENAHVHEEMTGEEKTYVTSLALAGRSRTRAKYGNYHFN